MKSYKIVIIEDEELIREELKTLLSQCGVCGRLRYQFCKNNRLH